MVDRVVLGLGAFFFFFDLAMLLLGFWVVARIGRTEDLDTAGPIPMGFRNWNARRIATIAVMMALCVVATFFPIPSPSGTIGLDLGPAYFMALYAGPVNGAIVALFGHMAVATRAGFPLTVPVHIGIGIAAGGVGAAMWMITHRLFPKRLPPDVALIIAIGLGIVGNTFGTNILLSYIFVGTAMAIGTVGPIFIGSSANVLIGSIVWRAVRAFRGGAVRVT